MYANINEYKGNSIMLYPVYFNIDKSIEGGRKYRKELCIKDPKPQDFRKALDQANIEYTFEASKRHPRETDQTMGRFLIKTNELKRKEIVEKLGAFLVENRAKKAEASGNAKVQNTLGLVRKKKKGKK